MIKELIGLLFGFKNKSNEWTHINKNGDRKVFKEKRIKMIIKKIFPLVLALFFKSHVANAATQYTGQATQPVSIQGTPTINANINAGSNNIGTVTGSTVTITAPNGNTTAIPVTFSGTQTVVSQSTTTAPTIKTTVATTSGQALAASNRKAVECEADCTNTDVIYINLGTTAATANGKALQACSSWEPPPGVIYTGAIQAISASGSQTIRCIEY